MPTGWTDVMIGGECVRAYVQDAAGPVEVHAPPGTEAAPGMPALIGEERYVVRNARNPGGRGEVTIIELITEAEATAARQLPGTAEASPPVIAKAPGRQAKRAPRARGRRARGTP